MLKSPRRTSDFSLDGASCSRADSILVKPEMSEDGGW